MYSTVSSGVNSLAAVVLEDVIKPCHVTYRGRHLAESTAALVTKVFGNQLPDLDSLYS
jgi:hypothetical protein